MEETKETLLHQLDDILQQYKVSSGYSDGLNDPNYTLQHKEFHQVSVAMHPLHVSNFIHYTSAAHIMCKRFVLNKVGTSSDRWLLL